jgi:hypothetical protein
MRKALGLAVLVTLGALPARAFAGAFTGPTDVNAQPDGSFSFTAVYVAGSVDEGINTFGFYPVTNAGGSVAYDCGCDFASCVLPAGQSSGMQVFGSLIDPTMNGVVHEGWANCAGQGASLLTTIHAAPAPPVPATTPGARAALLIALLAAGAAALRRVRALLR